MASPTRKGRSSAAPRVRRPPETEVEAYSFIRQRLGELGWAVKSPSQATGGQVWTQNQCLAHADMKAAFGTMRPENVVKISESAVWIIEAKASRNGLSKAIDEAIDEYANRINDLRISAVRAVLATGVAGSEQTGYLVTTKIRIDGRWRPVTINSQDATGLLSPENIRTLLEQNGSDIRDYAPPQRFFLQSAERINEILHLGGINKNDRAKTMAALLLSVLETPPDVDSSLTVLINDINTRSAELLQEHGKPEFAPFVRILPPSNKTNHVKFRQALIQTIQELRNLNIRSAMNSSTDVLGQFYEVFLKYGNGAKEIGIVLSPRHVTRFAVEAIGISSNDIVMDPACGTGGFLVAAFDHVRRTSTKAQVERFKQHGLFGIEQESYVAVLAIVNMIFRGDGKHNITEGNCFTTHLGPCIIGGHASAAFTKQKCPVGEEPVTRVLMNPPFSLIASHEKEYRFVSRALDLMTDGGLLFSLVPMDVMFGRNEEKIWRENDLLGHNTLLAVISFSDQLFVPAALKQVVGIIVKKGIPHPKQQDVFWGRVVHDGHVVVKTKRLLAADLAPPREEPNDIDRVLPALQSFMAHPGKVQDNEPLLYKTAPIDFTDPLLELLPEAYVDNVPVTNEAIEREIEGIVRETIASIIRFRQESDGGVLGIRSASPSFKQKKRVSSAKTMPFRLGALYELIAGDYHSAAEVPVGNVPLVSCGDADNGITCFVTPPPDKVYRERLTIAFNGMNTLTAKYHPYTFATKDDVAVCVPRTPMRLTTQVYIQAMINRERWRYSYYRKCFLEKLKRFSIILPVKGSSIDEDIIADLVSGTPYWSALKQSGTQN
jgi:type I restriction enzyme M protein